jgi:chemotaxis-related protein WspD
VTDSGIQPTDPSPADGQALDLERTPAAKIPSCWNKIGVYGDGDCPELQKFVHCRNCPIYSNAGLQLLNRRMPQEYRRAWTTHFAQDKKIKTPGNTSAVLFRINAEWFALPTQALQEVAESRRVHSLPHRRQGIVLGLANIRGELLICISLGHLLGLVGIPPRETLRSFYNRLLVVSWDGTRLAFPVDEVQGTHRFQSQELKAPPATVTKSNASYTQGILYWRDRAIGFLNPDVLFSTMNRSLT